MDKIHDMNSTQPLIMKNKDKLLNPDITCETVENNNPYKIDFYNNMSQEIKLKSKEVDELSKVDELIKESLEVIPEIHINDLNNHIRFDKSCFKTESKKLTKFDSMLKCVRNEFLKFTKQATFCDKIINDKISNMVEEMNKALSEFLPQNDISRNTYCNYSSYPNSSDVIGREISFRKYEQNNEFSKENNKDQIKEINESIFSRRKTTVFECNHNPKEKCPKCSLMNQSKSLETENDITLDNAN